MSEGPAEIKVIPGQLRLARGAIALSVEEAAAELGVPPDAIVRWERGDSEPALGELWRLGELYGRSTDFFFKETPAAPSVMSFRIPGKRGLEELTVGARRVLAVFEELCRAADELERLTNKPHEVLLVRAPDESDSGSLAESERRRLGLNGGPVEDMREVLEGQGVRTFELPVTHSEFSGLSWWHGQFGPCVMVNARDPSGRRTFSFAHEYAHLLKARTAYVCDPLTGARAGDERFADGFAAVFLMPADDVVDAFRSRGLGGLPLAVGQLASLARRYGVSLEAMAIRLEQLGLVPDKKAQEIIREIPPHYRRPRVPTWQRRLGRSYVGLATSAYGDGRISVGKLASYLRVPVRKALAFAQEAQKQQERES